MKFTKEKGITLIALVITIIVLIILAGISISLVLGENGLFNKAKSAATETAKGRFIEDAGFAYSEAYIEKVETSNANDITIRAVVEKLKSSYGYTDEQIVTVTSGVSGITLSETEITLEPGETKEVTVTLENGTYYALIEGLYYPIELSNGEITLGEGIASLQTGDQEEKTIQVEATLGSDIIDVLVEGNKIKITANDEQEQDGETTVTVTYGESITKTIKVKIKVGIKQGSTVDLGTVTVEVNNNPIKLAKGWKYFYNDEENGKVWLIYDGILEAGAHQISSDETIKLDGDNVYSSKDRQVIIDYLNGTGDYESRWNHIKVGIKNALGAKEINVGENQIEVKGSPNIELFQKAYDQMYHDEYFEIYGSDDKGYYYRFGGTGSWCANPSVYDFTNKPLFFLSSSHYWIASAHAGDKTFICYVNYQGNYERGAYYATIVGARPVVSIPKTAFEQLVK